MKEYCAVILLLTCMAFASASGGDTILCYFGSWAKWRPGDGKYTIQDINPNLCTHITYAFIGLNTDGSVNALGSTDDYAAFIGLKQQNPNVKLIISMGGWNMGSTTFSSVCNDDGLRATFVQNVYNYVTSNNFDGFDIDWEYPGQRGGASTDKQAYASFLGELRSKFAGTNLLITAAVGANIQSMSDSYDVPSMAKYLDYINIMSYDYHASYDGVTGENSPLYASGPLDLNASVEGWIQAGASPSQLLAGLPFYGHTFILQNPSNNGIGATTSGAGAAGPYTQQAGMLGYLEICQALNQGGWTTDFDSTEMVPYSYKGSEWIGYDNQQSLADKVNFAKQKGLGGVLIWSIETDDPHNYCGQGSNPLLTAVNNAMNGNAPAPSNPTPAASAAPASSAAPATSAAPTSSAAPAPSAPASSTCSAAGYFRSPGNCAAFFECVANGSGGFTQYSFTCPSGLVFDSNSSQCNYPAQVTC